MGVDTAEKGPSTVYVHKPQLIAFICDKMWNDSVLFWDGRINEIFYEEREQQAGDVS